MAAVAIDPPSDPELVAAWLAGDERAAAQLVRRHAEALGRYLVASGAASADLDDLVQDAFFKAFRALGGWRGDGTFRGWLFRIAVNLLKDGFRRDKGRIVLAIDDHDATDSADPAGDLSASETEQQLQLGLTRLAHLQREVFLLRAQQGMGYSEIATSLGTTTGAARVHYHNAVKRLKEWLE